MNSFISITYVRTYTSKLQYVASHISQLPFDNVYLIQQISLPISIQLVRISTLRLDTWLVVSTHTLRYLVSSKPAYLCCRVLDLMLSDKLIRSLLVGLWPLLCSTFYCLGHLATLGSQLVFINTIHLPDVVTNTVNSSLLPSLCTI